MLKLKKKTTTKKKKKKKKKNNKKQKTQTKTQTEHTNYHHLSNVTWTSAGQQKVRILTECLSRNVRQFLKIIPRILHTLLVSVNARCSFWSFLLGYSWYPNGKPLAGLLIFDVFETWPSEFVLDGGEKLKVTWRQVWRVRGIQYSFNI